MNRAIFRSIVNTDNASVSILISSINKLPTTRYYHHYQINLTQTTDPRVIRSRSKSSSTNINRHNQPSSIKKDRISNAVEDHQAHTNQSRSLSAEQQGRNDLGKGPLSDVYNNLNNKVSEPLPPEPETHRQTNNCNNSSDSNSNSNNTSTSLTTLKSSNNHQQSHEDHHFNQSDQSRILPNHAFDTYRFFKTLEWMITGPRGRILSKSYSKGQAYLYQAALDELQTSVNIKARNNGILIRTGNNVVLREIESLKQKLKDYIHGLKNELQIELNTRKEEANDEQNKLELSIQELNSKLTILTGEVRTEIETRKLVTTRRCVVAISTLALCVVIFTLLETDSIKPHKPTSSAQNSPNRRNTNRTANQTNSLRTSIGKDQLVDYHYKDNDADADSKKVKRMKSVEEPGIMPNRNGSNFIDETDQIKKLI
ncbi:hypothetical protein BY996DRAFT_6777928 [Phakopsora pachyrhizi]|nr:hypothetical protein BY996DRAFT_6777928 [Phakopsora pachyrhizi]